MVADFVLKPIAIYSFQSTVSEALTEYMKLIKADTEVHLCGVSNTGHSLATLVSVTAEKPLLIHRKGPRTCGKRKQIEGKFNSGDKCVMIGDVVTSGISLLKTAKALRGDGKLISHLVWQFSCVYWKSNLLV